MDEAALPGDRPARLEHSLGPQLSEFAATPVRVVVHDPAAAGALDLLAGVPAMRLEERYLFRSHPHPETFAAQHAALVAALERAGAEVIRLADVVGESDVWPRVRANPNQVYTRDPVITLPWLPGWYVAGAMRKAIRRPEVSVMRSALQALGLRELFAMPAERFLEGGDVIPFVREGRRALIVGFGPRTARQSLDLLCAGLMPWALDEIVAVGLPESRMNLDGVLVPVADDTVVAHPGSIETAVLRDPAGERQVDVLGLLRDLGMTVVEVTREESVAMQACNCVCLGDRRLVCYDLAGRVVRALVERDIDVRTIPGSELIKGTGGPRCMTRPLYV